MNLRALSLVALAVLGSFPATAYCQTDAALQGRVEALSGQIQLRYQAYRPALEPRMEALRVVLEQWNQATPAAGEASPANRARMNAWLSAALRSVMPGGSGKLPAAPRFEKEEPRAVAAPRLAAEPITPRPVRQQPTLAPRTTQAPPAPAGQAKPRRITRKPSRPNAPSTRSASPFAGPRLTAQPPRPTTAPAAQPAPVRRTPTLATRPRPVASAEPQDPFADDPNASPNPLRESNRRVAQRPVSSRRASAGINLSQLVAEVRGYNAALRELQARIMRLDDDVSGLSESADLLDHLDEKRQFLDLYRGGLSKADQNSVPSSPSAELIRELVRRKTIDLIRQTPPERRAERRVLERLNDRLARQGRTASAKF